MEKIAGNTKATKLKIPVWSKWMGNKNLNLGQAVLLSMNVSPNEIDTLEQSHPKKFVMYERRLSVAARETYPGGNIEFIQNHLNNGITPDSRMVKLSSFVSFAMSDAGWPKRLPVGFVGINTQVLGNDMSAKLKSKSAKPEGTRRASNEFVTKIIKVLVDISARAERNRQELDVDDMPGYKKDFFEAAIIIDPSLNKMRFELFDAYLLHICKFTPGNKDETNRSFYRNLYQKNETAPIES